MPGKVVTSAELVPFLKRARAQKQRVVFTNGCFDLMHVGHTRYLQAAKALGDILVVGVNSDASVRSLKKGAGRPIVGEAQRAEVVAAPAPLSSKSTGRGEQVRPRFDSGALPRKIGRDGRAGSAGPGRDGLPGW